MHLKKIDNNNHNNSCNSNFNTNSTTIPKIKSYNDNIVYTFYLKEDELSFVSELEKIAIHVSIKDKKLVKN